MNDREYPLDVNCSLCFIFKSHLFCPDFGVEHPFVSTWEGPVMIKKRRVFKEVVDE